jgi:hypothetical protein
MSIRVNTDIGLIPTIGAFLGWLTAPYNSRPQPAAQPPKTPAITVSRYAGTSSRIRRCITHIIRRARKRTGNDCVACQDAIEGSEVRGPCGHFYDIECILSLFSAATKDESLFPPRCCRQVIPVASVRAHMTPELIALFEEKTKEFGTLRRVYCATAACSAFLGAQSLRPGGWLFWGPTIFDCVRSGCSTRTCSYCKAAVTANGVHQCKTDSSNTSDEAVLALGDREGWKRCPGCEALVELNLGCFHITCRCRAQFCYVCRATWKSCACPQWDEHRLLAAAEQRVDIRHGVVDAGRRREAPAPARVQVAPVRVPVAPARVSVTPARAPVTPVPMPAAPVPTPAWRITTAQREAPTKARASTLENSEAVRAWLTSNTSTTSRHHPVAHIEPTQATSSREATSLTHTTLRAYQLSSFSGNPLVPSTPKQVIPSVPGVANRSSGPSETLRDRLIREAVEELRANHECDHSRWRFRQGGGHCQHCSHYLPHYLFVSSAFPA